MSTKDWSDFRLWCSGIQPILTYPKTCLPLNKNQEAKLIDLLANNERGPKEENLLLKYVAKKAAADNAPLSKVAISHLVRRYGYEKYAKKTAAKGHQFSFYEKGTLLEEEAIDLLSRVDKVSYKRNSGLIYNEFILGKVDVHSEQRKAILDVKCAWNISTFMNVLNAPLKAIYWYQMQGYLELYDIDYGEVCFCLLNTPESLIDREKIRLLNKYVFGEISREDYERHMETLELSLTYNNIPMRKRVIRFRVNRYRELMPKVYKKVEKCRDWLSNFEGMHTLGKEIITLPEDYAHTKENNTQSDSDESCEIDEG
jgi:hypothetical protein